MPHSKLLFYVYGMTLSLHEVITLYWNKVLSFFLNIILCNSSAFDAIILSIILVNCVFLALDNEIENAE